MRPVLCLIFASTSFLACLTEQNLGLTEQVDVPGAPDGALTQDLDATRSGASDSSKNDSPADGPTQEVSIDADQADALGTDASTDAATAGDGAPDSTVVADGATTDASSDAISAVDAPADATVDASADAGSIVAQPVFGSGVFRAGTTQIDTQKLISYFATAASSAPVGEVVVLQRSRQCHKITGCLGWVAADTAAFKFESYGKNGYTTMSMSWPLSRRETGSLYLLNSELTWASKMADGEIFSGSLKGGFGIAQSPILPVGTIGLHFSKGRTVPTLSQLRPNFSPSAGWPDGSFSLGTTTFLATLTWESTLSAGQDPYVEYDTMVIASLKPNGKIVVTKTVDDFLVTL